MEIDLSRGEISYLIDCILDSDAYVREKNLTRNLDRDLLGKLIVLFVIKEKK